MFTLVKRRMGSRDEQFRRHMAAEAFRAQSKISKNSIMENVIPTCIVLVQSSPMEQLEHPFEPARTPRLSVDEVDDRDFLEDDNDSSLDFEASQSCRSDSVL